MITGSSALAIGLAIAFIVSVVAIGIFSAFVRIAKKKSASGMDFSLSMHNRSLPSGMNDPNIRIKIDDLRQKFESGVAKFKSAGKDLYSLPWYLVVGEPGAGKTEAIRHSNIGFPPGLQDELQGTGGTINMNWWFTNHAVMLDTAGRLLFEDVKPGSSNEWIEFLKLLKKNRPTCPINGMVLVLPADSLIKDTAEEIERKARKIATQLDDIQRILDLRFPIFLLVSKSDLILGFREFFENIKDPSLQHQLLGWSNPSSLDEPFKPDTLETYLEGFIEDLNKRKLGLLHRNLKDSDFESELMYAFPSSLKNIFPRLKRYLELIFVSGEWSQKPLFLRGIYLTSSMQEGSALDQELANAMNLSVSELPGGQAWEREKSYFLRDVYIEKIFRERGLVTNASNTKKYLRKRRLGVIGAASAALFVLLGASWFAKKQMEISIGEHGRFWTEAGNPKHWKGKFWAPRIISERHDKTYSDNQESLIELEDEKIKLVDFHLKLAGLKSEKIQVPFIFKIFPSNINADREKAQRKVYEFGVMEPIFTAARRQMLSADSAAWNDSSTRALVALLKAQEVVVRNESESFSEPEAYAGIPSALMNFVCDTDNTEKLEKLFIDTYSGRGAWRSSVFDGASVLKDNASVKNGLNAYLGFVKSSMKKQAQGIDSIKFALIAFDEMEKAFDNLCIAAEQVNLPNYESLVRERFNAYSAAVQTVRSKIAELEKEDGGSLSLSKLYKNMVEISGAEVEKSMRELSESLPKDLVALGKENPQASIFADVSLRLDEERELFRKSLAALMDESQKTKMDAYDTSYLALYAQGAAKYVYERQLALFAAGISMFDLKTAEQEFGIENTAKIFATLNEDFLLEKRNVDAYAASRSKELKRAMNSILEHARKKRLESLALQYAKVAKYEILVRAGYPLLKDSSNAMTLKQLGEFKKFANGIVTDDSEKIFSAVSPNILSEIKSIKNASERLLKMSDIFADAAGNPIACRVSLLGESEELKMLAQKLEKPVSAIQHAGKKWTSMSIESDSKSFPPKRTRSGSVIAEIPVDSSKFEIKFYLTSSDADLRNVNKSMTLKMSWALIRLLSSGDAWSVDGSKTCNVMLEIEDGGVIYYQIISFTFPSAMPLSDTWPILKNLGLE